MLSLTPKKIIGIMVAVIFAGLAGGAVFVLSLSSSLPKLITIEDYEPLLVSEVFDRNSKKIGEFFREKRLVLPYDKIPKMVTEAVVASEDASFFQHSGVNYLAMLRALFANIRAGRKVQGASTITQQVARSLLLSREKTYIRKIKEIFLSYRMESNLKKEDILYLYLNQIYLGQGAYGVAVAADIYFRKPIEQLTLPEAALLAGLPQAPSRYSPVTNPKAAKERQLYVLRRMSEEGYITAEQAQAAGQEPVQVFVREDYQKLSPYYLETVRQLLVEQLGETQVLDKGLKIYTSLDLPRQLEAQVQVQKGLRELDKRQGYRGPLNNLQSAEEIAQFLLKTRDDLLVQRSPLRIIRPDGTFEGKKPLNISGLDDKGLALANLPPYLELDQLVQGIVVSLDDQWGLVTVRVAEAKGLIDLESMKWARKPNPNVKSEFEEIKRPSAALKKGDIILVRASGKKFVPTRINERLAELKKKLKKKYERPKELPDFNAHLEFELEQEPLAEASLLSFDLATSEVIALVGGYDFARSQFNRALQAARQTGSSFKPFVYLTAMDNGYTPASQILDAPVVYEEQIPDGEEGDETTKKWKPMNYEKKFTGDILFRQALIRSNNIATVRIIEKVGTSTVAKYAQRLGIFSPLNPDFTMGLGSSGVTLYEMTKAYAQVGLLGKRIRPLIVRKVTDRQELVLLENLSLDQRFSKELAKLDEDFSKEREAYQAKKQAAPEEKPQEGHELSIAEKIKAESPLFFDDQEQLIRPTSAYLLTSLLQGVIEEGTGGQARSLGRPVAGKTGTTDGSYDAWFIGYTPDTATGVWVGFDDEKTLGKGETGAEAALPIWIEYMKFCHQDLPSRAFPVPDGIVFANIDKESGKLASSSSKDIVRQAFLEGTQPSEISDETSSENEKDFYKEDLAQ